MVHDVVHTFKVPAPVVALRVDRAAAVCNAPGRAAPRRPLLWIVYITFLPGKCVNQKDFRCCTADTAPMLCQGITCKGVPVTCGAAAARGAKRIDSPSSELIPQRWGKNILSLFRSRTDSSNVPRLPTWDYTHEIIPAWPNQARQLPQGNL